MKDSATIKQLKRIPKVKADSLVTKANEADPERFALQNESLSSRKNKKCWKCQKIRLSLSVLKMCLLCRLAGFGRDILLSEKSIFCAGHLASESLIWRSNSPRPLQPA